MIYNNERVSLNERMLDSIQFHFPQQLLEFWNLKTNKRLKVNIVAYQKMKICNYVTNPVMVGNYGNLLLIL